MKRLGRRCGIGWFLVFAMWGTVQGAFAAWCGAGTAGGSPDATNINDTANWTDGDFSGDFRPIVSNVTLRFTSDCTFTNGLDFSAWNTVIRHIRIEGTNTITLGSTPLPGYDSKYNRNLFLASNVNCTVTLDRRLTLDFPGTRTFGGNSTLFADAKITGSGSITFSYTGGPQPYSVLRNDDNSFIGGIYGDGGNLHFTSVRNRGRPSALGAGTTIGINNYTVVYIGSRDSATDRTVTFQNNASVFRNDSACGGISLTGTVAIGTYVHTDIYLDGISAGDSLLSGNIPDLGYDSGLGKTFYTKLDKRHSGTWRLTGKNTFTGWTNNSYHVFLQGGTLIADYTNDVTGAGCPPVRGGAHIEDV